MNKVTIELTEDQVRVIINNLKESRHSYKRIKDLEESAPGLAKKAKDDNAFKNRIIKMIIEARK